MPRQPLCSSMINLIKVCLQSSWCLFFFSFFLFSLLHLSRPCNPKAEINICMCRKERVWEYMITLARLVGRVNTPVECKHGPVTHWLCSQRNESRSERRFGSRSASWLGSWFELRAFTCIANAVPITIRSCALRGNIVFPLRSPRWLTHAWLQRAFPKRTRTNHIPKELWISLVLESGFLRGSRSKMPFFRVLKSLIWKSFAFTRGKIRL